MVKHIVHLFVLPLRALVMVVATLPTGQACGGPVTGKACPMPSSAHHRVLHPNGTALGGWSLVSPVSWKVAPAELPLSLGRDGSR
jgi:hypothetical protein